MHRGTGPDPLQASGTPARTTQPETPGDRQRRPPGPRPAEASEGSAYVLDPQRRPRQPLAGTRPDQDHRPLPTHRSGRGSAAEARTPPGPERGDAARSPMRRATPLSDTSSRRGPATE